MQQIAPNVYIEEDYAGVVLGVVNFPQGLVQIDAPPSPEDARTWRAAMLNLGSGVERLLINLDAHLDRTLGARAMDCTIIAHEKTAAAFRNRPNTFKAQGEETGADWESVAGLGSIRWSPPEITFTQQMTIEWGKDPVVLEHHPGPATGAIWVILPAQKVVFVGDAVLKGQPPYLSNADLPLWIEALEHLLEPGFKHFNIISGRNGHVTPAAIRSQIEYLGKIHAQLGKLAAAQAAPEATEKLIAPLLAVVKPPAARQRQYAQRLRHGLLHYYLRHYYNGGTIQLESEE